MVFEFRHAINVVMGVVEVFVARVTEALVPKKAFGAGVQTVKKEFGFQRGEVRKVVPDGMDRTVMWRRGR